MCGRDGEGRKKNTAGEEVERGGERSTIEELGSLLSAPLLLFSLFVSLTAKPTRICLFLFFLFKFFWLLVTKALKEDRIRGKKERKGRRNAVSRLRD